MTYAGAILCPRFAPLRKRPMLSRQAIELINYKVNQLPYRSDPALYFTPEFWTAITTLGGDCEDFGIEKYIRLIHWGFSASALRLGTCWIKSGMNAADYHAVTIVRFNNQDLCLCNRYPHVMEIDLLPYEFHKLQVAGTQEWEYEKQFAVNYPDLCVQ